MVGAPSPAPVSAQAVIIPGYYDDGCAAMKHASERTVDERVGARIKVGEDIGTVKYVGEVFGHQGVWFGVEWDEPERGRHSGTVDNIHYFSTSKPGAGSFVRPGRAAPTVTCADAIEKHYAYKEDEATAAHRKCAINEVKREIGAPFIEMVGFDKLYRRQGNLESLEEAYVRDENISTAGAVGQLCPNLRLLDVSRNLFRGWREVIQLASQLPKLNDLDLSKNRLELDLTLDELRSNAAFFASLRRLNLSHCGLTWPRILALSQMWPGLEELVAAHNAVRALPPPGGLLDALSVLKMDGNELAGWGEVLNLGRMKSLKVLSLNECGLTEVWIDKDGGLFSNLEVLLLNRNCIADWRSVSELDKLPSLKRLYFLKNPVQAGLDYDTTSQMIIARIGSIQELNGCIITAQMRRGAEYDYLKQHGAQYKMADEKFALDHTRFQKLVDKYGIPEESLLTRQPKHTSLASKLIEIQLRDATGRTVTKKFPSNMMVQKLTTLAQRLMGKGAPGPPQLHCVDADNGRQIHLDSGMKDLNYYSVRDGDTVMVRWN